MNDNLIQLTANKIIVAAETDMDRVIELESEHGKCINYREYSNQRIWIFDDRYEYKINK